MLVRRWLLAVGQRDRLAFDVFIFVFIYMIPGAVVLVSYSLTGTRLLTSDESLRRQQSPGGVTEAQGHCQHELTAVDSPRRRRRRRHASSPVQTRLPATRRRLLIQMIERTNLVLVVVAASRKATTPTPHRHRYPLEDRREIVGVSFSLPHE